VLGRAARLLIHKEPIGKAVELLCTLIRTDTTPVQLVTLLHMENIHGFITFHHVSSMVSADFPKDFPND
jgi:hypothetical protein